VSPSKREIADRISAYEIFFDKIIAKESRLIKEKHMLEGCGESSEQVERINADLNKISKDLEFHNGNLRQLSSMQSKNGKVLMSSGRKLFDGRISDWAFVELDSDRSSFPNTMPSYRSQESQDPRFSIPNVAGPGTPGKWFEEIQPGEIYLKEGRNTGVTVGICNGV
jgi:hypothetical protein